MAEVESVVKATLEEIEKVLSTKTVVGEPMTQIGAIFKTGEKVNVSGVYSYERHMESMTPFTCTPTHEEEKVELSEGDTFPAHKECNQGVIWKLARKT